MASSLFVSGPSFWYVRTGAGATYQYLGMCEAETNLSISPEYEDVMIDGGGMRMPFDRQFMGAVASVSGDLVRFDHTVLNLLRNFVNDPAQTPGTWVSGTIGTLLRTEGKAMGLAIVSQYATKDAYSNTGMPGGWVFPFVTMMPTSEGLGMRAKRVRVSFDCLPVLNGLGGGVLFTNDIASLDLPTPT